MQTEQFAQYLFENGEYYRAITEYYKLIFSTSDQEKKSQFLKSIGLCYYHGNDYDGMITFFHKNRTIFMVDTTIFLEMKLLSAKSTYQLGSYSEAISALENIDASRNDSLSDDKYCFLSLSYAHRSDWDNSYKYLSFIKKEPKYLSFRDYMLDRKEALTSFSKKDPTLAGIFSAVIPGTGYAYCHRVSTGIISFVVNGILVWAVYDAYKNKQYGLSASLSFFGIGWYIGNIIGSVNAANQYNVSIEENILNNVKIK